MLDRAPFWHLAHRYTRHLYLHGGGTVHGHLFFSRSTQKPPRMTAVWPSADAEPVSSQGQYLPLLMLLSPRTCQFSAPRQFPVVSARLIRSSHSSQRQGHLSEKFRLCVHRRRRKSDGTLAIEGVGSTSPRPTGTWPSEETRIYSALMETLSSRRRISWSAPDWTCGSG
jgi:hypothetical protein